MVRLVYFLLCLSFFSYADLTKKDPPYRVYLNSLEEQEFLTVFNQPGVNWSNCTPTEDPKTKEKSCKEVVGWLDNDSNIRVIGKPFSMRSRKPRSNDDDSEDKKYETQEYVEVEFFYARLGKDGQLISKDGRAFIPTHHLSEEKLNSPIYKKDEPPPKIVKKKKLSNDNVPCDCKPTVASSDLKTLQDKSKLIIESVKEAQSFHVEKLNVSQAAEKLNNIVGFCAGRRTTKPPLQLPRGSPYDQLIYNKLKNADVPAILGEDGEVMSRQDLVDIDSLARTLYGEMAQCYRHGLQYPMAVAKIIVNRSEQDDDYVRGSHAGGKPNLSKVATSASQFSMWQKTKKTKRGVSANGPLFQGLCPPRAMGEPYYRGDSAPQIEFDIWKNTMKIATEAVLFPEQFKTRTKNVTELHYTSNLSHYKKMDTDDVPKGARFIKKMTQVFPVIENRTVDFNRCLEIWKLPPPPLKKIKKRA